MKNKDKFNKILKIIEIEYCINSQKIKGSSRNREIQVCRILFANVAYKLVTTDLTEIGLFLQKDRNSIRHYLNNLYTDDKNKVELLTRKYIDKYGKKGSNIVLDELVNSEVIEIFKSISEGLKDDMININEKITRLDSIILKLENNK
jgi:hypothetical protein